LELAKIGVITKIDEKLWSANGNCYLDVNAPDAWGAAGAVVPNTNFALDCFSPFNFGSDQTGDVGIFGEADAASLAEFISTACSIVRDSSPLAWQFVESVIDAIAVRKVINSPNAFSSGSFGRRARVMLLSFGAVKSADLAQVANALVHEAIHSLLFMFEETNGEFVDRSICRDPLVVRSPWTGRMLRLDAYVHACVVWYGLYWLWQEFQANLLISETRQSEMANFARAGFSQYPVSTGLSEWRKSLSPPIMELLSNIELEMLDA